MTRTKRIAVAMSGGVDSSVAAHLLVERYKSSLRTSIFGLFMQNWAPQDELLRSSSFCETSERDRMDAENVCSHLSIPLHTTHFGE